MDNVRSKPYKCDTDSISKYQIHIFQLTTAVHSQFLVEKFHIMTICLADPSAFNNFNILFQNHDHK